MMQDNGINNSIHQTDFIDEKDFPIMLSVGNNSDFLIIFQRKVKTILIDNYCSEIGIIRTEKKWSSPIRKFKISTFG